MEGKHMVKEFRVQIKTGSLNAPQFDAISSTVYVPIGGGRWDLRHWLNEPHPTVIVVHDERGQLPYVQEFAWRLSREGFVALAPDLFTRDFAPEDAPTYEMARALLSDISEERMLRDLGYCAEWTQRASYCEKGKLGAVGFGWGGYMVQVWSCIDADVKAAASLSPPRNVSPVDKLAKLENPYLLVAGTRGSPESVRVLAETEEALKKTNKKFEVELLPEVPPYFFVKDSPCYEPAAANTIEKKTIAFFKKSLESTLS